MIRNFPAGAIAATCMVAAALLPATPVAAQASIPAGGQRCIVTNRIIDKKGYYDNSRVELTNRCPQPVAAYVCIVAVYQTDFRAPCDPRFGGYSSSTFAPNQRISSGVSSSAQAVVSVRECPTGYRLGRGDMSSFPCVR